VNTGADSALDIPRHISILPSGNSGRGGYLGDQFDAFRVNDPVNPVPDIRSYVSKERGSRRLESLEFLDRQFLKTRANSKTVEKSLGSHNLDAALKMMSSQQLDAFDVSNVPVQQRLAFGDTAFGRSWDTHVNNHELQAGRIEILDSAFATLISELKRRGLLESTMVVCGGEFGRTPFLNPLGGRDHWPHGFSIAMAGGGLAGGRVIGETNPTPQKGEKQPKKLLKNSRPIEDVHATILSLLGVDYEQELDTPIGRPLKICEGTPIKALQAGS